MQGERDDLKTWERAVLWGLAFAAVAFGVLVTVRTAYLSRRMGDLGVYTRAGWSARHGGSDLYSLRCDNGWSYNYPPLLAILFVPLADAPKGQSGSGPVPYEFAAVLWYVLNVAFLAGGVHLLASAHEAVFARSAAVGRAAWWRLRLLPLFACLPAIGSSLMKGQTNLLVLFALCGFLASLALRRSFRAGLFLSLAVCVKIFPAFLLIVPLQRRDARCLVGCAVGMLVGLLLIPLLAFGPERTASCYRELARVTLGPGLGIGEDVSRSVELTGANATDNHNFRSLLHNALHAARDTRPHVVSPAVNRLHWLLGGAMLLATLAVFWRNGRDDAGTLLLFGGASVVVLLMICPVTHLHYFCFLLPLVMTLTGLRGGERVSWTPLTGALQALPVAAVVLEQLPGMTVFRDLCSASLGAVVLWGVACCHARKDFFGEILRSRFASGSIAN